QWYTPHARNPTMASNPVATVEKSRFRFAQSINPLYPDGITHDATQQKIPSSHVCDPYKNRNPSGANIEGHHHPNEKWLIAYFIQSRFHNIMALSPSGPGR